MERRRSVRARGGKRNRIITLKERDRIQIEKTRLIHHGQNEEKKGIQNLARVDESGPAGKRD